MRIVDNFLYCIGQKYVSIDGRASRGEFWWFQLAAIILRLVAAGLQYETRFPHIVFVLNLLLLLPGITVTIRRLHDTDRSGWWYLIALVPLVGWIIILIFMILQGDPLSNRFGTPPSASTWSRSRAA